MRGRAHHASQHRTPILRHLHSASRAPSKCIEDKRRCPISSPRSPDYPAPLTQPQRLAMRAKNRRRGCMRHLPDPGQEYMIPGNGAMHCLKGHRHPRRWLLRPRPKLATSTLAAVRSLTSAPSMLAPCAWTCSMPRCASVSCRGLSLDALPKCSGRSAANPDLLDAAARPVAEALDNPATGHHDGLSSAGSARD